jgi:hypothetical protein
VVKRWIVLVVVVGVVGAAVVYLRSRPLDVHVRDIQSIKIDPYPEGPPGPEFTRGKRPGLFVPEDLFFPFDEIGPFVPDPLPNTAWQGLNCTMGGNLIVTLRDRETITYGPCRRPESINELWAHMLDISSRGECRPRCGPGGQPGP